MATGGLWALSPVPHASAQVSETPPIIEVSAFDLLTHSRAVQGAVRLVQGGRAGAAEEVLRTAIERGPPLPVLHYTLALVLVQQNKRAAALDSLAAAIANGFIDADGLMNDTRFAALHGDPRFGELLEHAGKAPVVQIFKPVAAAPAAVADLTAMVGRSNTLWDPRLGVLKSLFDFQTERAANETVYDGPDRAMKKLNRWYAKGLAAGNHGDLYDNRDRGHSRLSRDAPPQLTFLTYGEDAVAADVDYNLNSFLVFNAITIGNSSLAVAGGPFWRSLPRVALSQPDAMTRLFLHYANNHVYVYPEHRDHDPEHGDVFPANTPYVIVSQGSSGSDLPFVQALAAILAAFTPETKNFLRSSRLVMPTVQMIFRKGQRTVGNERTYLTGAAHPSVFRSGDIDLARMISLASRLKADEVPPMPVVEVIEEDEALPGVDYFAPGLQEKLFDTPSAIARIVRSTSYTRRMVLSAQQTRDPTGRELTYHWTVLRGDAQRIQIRRLNEAGSKVELVVPWHERRPVPGHLDLTTDRVDIGLIVHNGEHHSAPAFVSFMFPGNQSRQYDERQRIVSVDYQAPEISKRYVDPLLFPERDWKDVYEYDGEGRLLGWRRYREGEVTRYTRHGVQVVLTDALDRPMEGVDVTYRLIRSKSGTTRVVEEPIEGLVTYSYHSDEDGLGIRTPESQN